MKKSLLLLIGLLFSITITAQSNFSVIYNFNNSYAADITQGNDAISAENAIIGGTKLSGITFQEESGETVLKSTITNNNSTYYKTSYLRVNIKPKTGYTFVITDFVVNQKSTKIGNSYLFRQGVSLNQTVPNNADLGSATGNTKFSDSYTDYTFLPSVHVAKGKNSDYTTLWLTAKEPGSTTFDWHVNSIVISGEYISSDTETSGSVTISPSVKQNLRFGIDAERLWYWRTGSFGNTLADLAVKELKSEFVRVAVNCAYEREEGVVNSTAYDKIIDMMTAMKLSNPDIKFFASPRPLNEAYSNQEEIDVWGGKCPWSPAPSWVIPWTENGTSSDGTTKWKIGSVKAPKLTRYYADYLNLMHSHGFKIDYLDITNEKNDVSATICKYLFDNIPELLDSGVYMPELVAPSSWSFEQGVKYLDDFSENQLSSFTIAASHNTNAAGSPKAFSDKANSINKEPWNTELHGWTGITIQDEIVSSKYFFDHINSGIVGLDSWLFFGPKDGKDHTMIWSNSNSYTRSSKYNIFKKVVNNANGGNYIETTSIGDGLIATSFIKNNTTMVCVLNESNFDKPSTEIDFGTWNINDKAIEVTEYSSNIPREGATNSMTTSNDKVVFNAKAKSLFIFKIDNVLNTDKIQIDKNQLTLYPNPSKGIMYLKSENHTLINKDYQIIGIDGRVIKSGVLNLNTSINTSFLNKGVYILKIKEFNSSSYSSKFIIE
jgi:hypothetical protein